MAKTQLCFFCVVLIMGSTYRCVLSLVTLSVRYHLFERLHSLTYLICCIKRFSRKHAISARKKKSAETEWSCHLKECLPHILYKGDTCKGFYVGFAKGTCTKLQIDYFFYGNVSTCSHHFGCLSKKCSRPIQTFSSPKTLLLFAVSEKIKRISLIIVTKIYSLWSCRLQFEGSWFAYSPNTLTCSPYSPTMGRGVRLCATCCKVLCVIDLCKALGLIDFPFLATRRPPEPT